MKVDWCIYNPVLSLGWDAVLESNSQSLDVVFRTLYYHKAWKVFGIWKCLPLVCDGPAWCLALSCN
eukprot:1360397-Amorphochlora_amoeboformis.AAC.1